ncbi:MAG: c-type cytochrome, partial [Bacteroidota bacterium]
MTFYYKPSRSTELTRVSARLLITLSFIFSIGIFNSNAAVSVSDGQKLFANNCRSCHNTPDKDQQLVGPSLKNEDTKRSEAWLLKWIRNNVAFRQSGDAEAIAVFEKFGKASMTQFLSFSDDDIKSIIAYIHDASNKAPVVATAPTGGVSGDMNDESADNYTGILWVVVIVLIGISFLIFRINNNLRHYAAEKMGDGVPEERPFFRSIFTKGNIALMLFICVMFLGYWLVDATQGLGRSRNYQPIQPIKFSHKVHAGQNQINCLYCHAGAEKSKTASIPSVNI